MLNLRLIILLLLLFAGNLAQANCRVLDRLDKLHAVQLRLIQNPNSPIFDSEMLYLRRQTSQLDNTLVLNSVDASALSARGATFLRFTRHANEIATQISIDDQDRLRQHYANPNVVTNLNTVGNLMSDLRCTAAEIASAPQPSYGEDQLSEAARNAIINFFEWLNFAIMILTILVASAIAWVFKYRENAAKHKKKAAHF